MRDTPPSPPRHTERPPKPCQSGGAESEHQSTADLPLRTATTPTAPMITSAGRLIKRVPRATARRPQYRSPHGYPRSKATLPPSTQHDVNVANFGSRGPTPAVPVVDWLLCLRPRPAPRCEVPAGTGGVRNVFATGRARVESRRGQSADAHRLVRVTAHEDVNHGVAI